MWESLLGVLSLEGGFTACPHVMWDAASGTAQLLALQLLLRLDLPQDPITDLALSKHIIPLEAQQA